MRGLILIGILFYTTVTLAQEEHAWVYLKDKPNANTQLENPITILSQKALDRRTKQNIDLNINDAPLETTYITSIASSTGISIKAKSKWLNALHVFGTQTNINALINLTFVDSIHFASKELQNVLFPKTANNNIFKKVETYSSYSYGQAQNQVEMLGVDLLHDQGYDGLNIDIAIIDAGFYGVNTAGAFGHLVDQNLNNGEVLGGYDYVNQSDDIYIQTGSTHGTQVLSTIAAIKENEYTGIAPSANFYLFTTEDVYNETPLEESLWVQAAEKADSLGIDIINTSLGYTQFDESKYDYTYEDMDGKTTFIARGAHIASQKGMLIVNSIGNSGTGTWKYLTTPADAEGVIAVGSVNANESISSFSSYGPTYDDRIKPETLAQGGSVYVVDENNDVKTSNGTSFSSPIIAGALACLWQAYPYKTSDEIRTLVIENSNEYSQPTDQEGYGVFKIENLAQNSLSSESNTLLNCCNYKYQNKTITFVFNEGVYRSFYVTIYDSLGALMLNKEISRTDNTIDLSNLLNGLYIIQYTSNQQMLSKKILITH